MYFVFFFPLFFKLWPEQSQVLDSSFNCSALATFNWCDLFNTSHGCHWGVVTCSLVLLLPGTLWDKTFPLNLDMATWPILVNRMGAGVSCVTSWWRALRQRVYVTMFSFPALGPPCGRDGMKTSVSEWGHQRAERPDMDMCCAQK